MLFPFFVAFFLIGLCASDKNDESEFTLEYQWTFLNFTWDSEDSYNDAVAAEQYIPGNNAMTGVKYYKNRFYIAMPRVRSGSPVTLGYISAEDSIKVNPLIIPFPNWEMNNQVGDCDTYFESVQSMEIDTNGIMWVIDGHRTNPNMKCPPKILLIDLNDDNKILQSFAFPEQVCLSQGGFLNDIVVDESEGGFAYLSDHSNIDPGLIVYSRKLNRGWKVRDASMYPVVEASHFIVDGHENIGLSPIDGIALSPPSQNNSRDVYYSAVYGYNLYSISTEILKDEELCNGAAWRYEVKNIGRKQGQSDGLLIDNKGDFYYGLLPLNAVGKWNIYEPFSTAEIIDQDNETMIWPDCFFFDDKGYMYLLANNIDKFFDQTYQLEVTDKIMFAIFSLFTNTNSYLYP